jgi:hypothetical protein
MIRSAAHNIIVHPIAGIAWLAADVLGLFGMGQRLARLADRLHSATAPEVD